MKDPILDDDHEGSEGMGRGQLWIAAACVALSAIGGVLWIVLLTAPHIAQ